jgi:hypothetical protein
VAAAAAVMLALSAGGATAQSPSTRAERTGYAETSRYDDVVAFLDTLAAAPALHVRSFGYSSEGRALPLVVAGRGLESGSPREVLAGSRMRVLLLANIHAGEVEGKEAVQRLLRDVASGVRDRWLDSMVILAAPIYNVDGNERVAVTNRARQNGPVGGVGTRENALGLDLNRDNMKLASPEARALVGVFNDYDPHIVVDLHATNGTRHAYHLTWSPPLHPSTDAGITGMVRDRLLPEVTRRILEERGWHLHSYGNAYAPPGMERGWYTFDHRPRFSTNYVGLRNRVGILSEAYAYLDFRGRVEATLAFVEGILDFAGAHASAITEVTRAADAVDLVGERQGLRAAFHRDSVAEILMGATEERLSPVSGRRYLARLDMVTPERMPEYGSFSVTEWERVPEAYYLPPGLDRVVDLLTLHGIRPRPVEETGPILVERFVIDSTRVAEREFQGHREREVFGRWEPVRLSLPPGTVAVELRGQPLARLVFHLLEPRSDDGVLNWNVLDPQIGEAPSHYPVLRRPPPE